MVEPTPRKIIDLCKLTWLSIDETWEPHELRHWNEAADTILHELEREPVLTAASRLLAACEASLDLLEEMRIRLHRYGVKDDLHWDERTLAIIAVIEAAKGVSCE